MVNILKHKQRCYILTPVSIFLISGIFYYFLSIKEIVEYFLQDLIRWERINSFSKSVHFLLDSYFSNWFFSPEQSLNTTPPPLPPKSTKISPVVTIMNYGKEENRFYDSEGQRDGGEFQVRRNHKDEEWGCGIFLGIKMILKIQVIMLLMCVLKKLKLKINKCFLSEKWS